MALFISERDVETLVSMSDAIKTVSEAFRYSGEGKVINPPRQAVPIPGGTLRITYAVIPPMQRMAVKVSSTLVFSSNAGRILILSDLESGRILALIEVFRLGALRTGAASGVATQLLARTDAKTVGIFGSGRQARTQLLAVASVRPVERVSVLSPNAAHLAAFCEEMEAKLRCSVRPARTQGEIYDSDVVVSATTSQEPVILGRWLKPGTHINAIGANTLQRREFDEDAAQRCAVIAVDDREQAKQEAAELVRAIEKGSLTWDMVRELGEIAAGRSQGRPGSDSITLYKSLGVAMEDVALASLVYELAVQRGVGVEVPLTDI